MRAPAKSAAHTGATWSPRSPRERDEYRDDNRDEDAASKDPEFREHLEV